MLWSTGEKHLEKKRVSKFWQNPLRVMWVIFLVILAALMTFMVLGATGCTTTKASASYVAPAPTYYLTYVKNDNATSFTFLLRMKVNNKIRVHQSLNPGQSSIPLKLKRDVIYTLVFWCEVDQVSGKVEFMNQSKPIILHGHNCTDFGTGGAQKRKAA